MDFHVSYFIVVVTEIFLVDRKKKRMPIKEKCFIHKLKKQIVPLGTSLIDEEQISRKARNR